VSPRLQDRVAVVSGSGAGIGRAIATHLAAAGARVVVADIDGARVEDAVGAIAAATRGAVLGVTADASTNDGVRNMLAKATETFGRLDILVNNAGVPDYWKTLVELSDADWQRNIDINLTGPFKACRAAMPIMLAQGKGAIVNLASISSFRGGRSGLAYTVAKHGVVGLTKAIAVEYGDVGIRCNCISPGSVVTSLASMDGMSEEGMKIREKGIVTRPPRAQPDDIAPTVVFLVSDDSHYINGTNVVIDAGWTAW
jgi:NAD(P)-dependent dehydrogenase (short-subunit alcohol dehydrogenase family)